MARQRYGTMSLRRALRVSREPFRFVNQRNTRLNNALLLGTVVGTAMEKTVKVEIKRMSLHNALLKVGAESAVNTEKAEDFLANHPQ